LDEGRLFDDLAAAMPGHLPDSWAHPLKNHDHLVLAEERSRGQRIALLGTIERVVGGVPVLGIETAYFTPQRRPQRLLARMIALAILRVAQTSSIPRAIAVRTREPNIYQTLAHIAERIPEAVLYPDTDPVILPLAGASLARGIARQRGYVRLATASAALLGGEYFEPCRETGLADKPGADPDVEALFRCSLQAADQLLVVLDCRAADETSLTEAMRRIYQLR